ncbi:hypothetical protein IW245_007658 [Longispora fulva]|uniref:Uncharacterized protein n=1 Tax=Longispora fulva TaxID=619741 RepID=A0A8J7GY96_9ACTN|nr:hypothetical protein [Longispora fulva]
MRGLGRRTRRRIARGDGAPPVGSFDRAADNYRHGRPDDPPRVYELHRAHGLGPGCGTLEVGTGTGQATRERLAHGATVTAVEPGPSLAALLRADLVGPRCGYSTLRSSTWTCPPRPSISPCAPPRSTAWIRPSPYRCSRVRCALRHPGGVMDRVQGPRAAHGVPHGRRRAARPVPARFGRADGGDATAAADPGAGGRADRQRGVRGGGRRGDPPGAPVDGGGHGGCSARFRTSGTWRCGGGRSSWARSRDWWRSRVGWSPKNGAPAACGEDPVGV